MSSSKDNEELTATAKELIHTGRDLRKAADSFDDEVGAILGGEAARRSHGPVTDLSPDPRGFAVNELTSMFDGHHASLSDDAKRFLELGYFAEMVRFHLASTKHYADTTGDGLASFGSAAKVIGNQYEESDDLADKQLNKLDKLILAQLHGTELILGEYREINTTSGPPASAPPPPSLTAPQPPGATDWAALELHEIVYLIIGIHNQEVGELGHRFGRMGALLAAYQRRLNNSVLGLDTWQGRAATAYRQHADHATASMHQWVVGLPERHKTITGAEGATTAIRVAQETIQAAVTQLRKELTRWQEVLVEAQRQYEIFLVEAAKGSYQFGSTTDWNARFEGIRAGIESSKEDAKAAGVEAGTTLAAALVKAAPWNLPGPWQGMRGLTERPQKHTGQQTGSPGGAQGVAPPKITPIDNKALQQLQKQVKQDQKKMKDLLKQLEDARKKALEQQQVPPPGSGQQPPGAVAPPAVPAIPAIPGIPAVPTVPPVPSPWTGTPWTPAPTGGRGSLTGRGGSSTSDSVLSTASNTLLGRDSGTEASLSGGSGGGGDGSSGMPFFPPMMPPGLGGGGGGGGGAGSRAVRRSGGPRLVQDDRQGSPAITGRGRDDKRAKPKIVELETESWTSEPQTAEVEETKPTAPGRVLGT